ncbi:hypothetical protein R0K19_26820, partial [Bacillus sp. SIMBA_161]
KVEGDMKCSAYIRNSLFYQYDEQEETGMTEAELITHIALQMGMEKSSGDRGRGVGGDRGDGEAQIAQALKKLGKLRGVSNA